MSSLLLADGELDPEKIFSKALLRFIYLFFVGLFIAIGYINLDNDFLPEQNGVARITGKKFIPAHQSISHRSISMISMMRIGKIPLPTAQNISDQFLVEISLGDCHKEVEVSREFYEHIYYSELLAQSRKIHVTYVQCRLSRKILIKDVLLEQDANPAW
jgi:hypothetical protein